jgi:L-amino acid N-acyltransferase YncA
MRPGAIRGGLCYGVFRGDFFSGNFIFPMQQILIRPAALADIAAITRIYADAVVNGTASFEIEPPDEAEMTRRQAALLNNGYPYLAAEVEGAIAGFAYAGPYRSRPAYKWSVEDSIYVAPAMHRKGIGGLLLRRLVAESEQRGFRQMIAVIGDSAQIGSIAVHERAGFSHIGTLRSVGFKHGKWLDTVLMQRALGKSDTTTP